MSKAPRMQWSCAWQREDGTYQDAVDQVGHELIERLDQEMQRYGAIRLVALRPTQLRGKAA